MYIQYIFLSNAIGNLAIVETIDKQVVLLNAESKVATFPGYFDCPENIHNEITFQMNLIRKTLY